EPRRVGRVDGNRVVGAPARLVYGDAERVALDVIDLDARSRHEDMRSRLARPRQMPPPATGRAASQSLPTSSQAVSLRSATPRNPWETWRLRLLPGSAAPIVGTARWPNGSA